MHNSWVELRPSLILAALGGSCPSYVHPLDTPRSEMTSIYQAYPYFNETLFKHDLSGLLSQLPTTPHQILLMTHDGPHFSATTIDKTTKLDQSADIMFGSQYLYNLLKEDAGKTFIANIHGHAHDGSPSDKITDKIRIINPGSLKFGEFAQLKLVKDEKGWRVGSYNKHYL